MHVQLTADAVGIVESDVAKKQYAGQYSHDVTEWDAKCQETATHWNINQSVTDKYQSLSYMRQ